MTGLGCYSLARCPLLLFHCRTFLLPSHLFNCRTFSPSTSSTSELFLLPFDLFQCRTFLLPIHLFHCITFLFVILFNSRMRFSTSVFVINIVNICAICLYRRLDLFFAFNQNISDALFAVHLVNIVHFNRMLCECDHQCKHKNIKQFSKVSSTTVCKV